MIVKNQYDGEIDIVLILYYHVEASCYTNYNH